MLEFVEAMQELSIQSAIQLGTEKLGGLSARLDIELLLAHALSVSRLKIITEPMLRISAEQYQDFILLLERRAAHEPIALIVGKKEFYDRDFEVTTDTLVPRPETEFIIEFAIKHLPNSRPLQVLDWGTGSGCLAITLAVELRQKGIKAEVIAHDISNKSLSVAKRNSDTHHADVKFIEGNWGQGLEGQAFDLILSNPPYIAAGDKEVGPETEFEPKLALYSGVDGLDAYRTILPALNTYLKPGGLFIGEHGRDQRVDLAKIAAQCLNCSSKFVDDLSGRERFIIINKQL